MSNYSFKPGVSSGDVYLQREERVVQLMKRHD